MTRVWLLTVHLIAIYPQKGQVQELFRAENDLSNFLLPFLHHCFACHGSSEDDPLRCLAHPNLGNNILEKMRWVGHTQGTTVPQEKGGAGKLIFRQGNT